MGTFGLEAKIITVFALVAAGMLVGLGGLLLGLRLPQRGCWRLVPALALLLEWSAVAVALDQVIWLALPVALAAIAGLGLCLRTAVFALIWRRGAQLLSTSSAQWGVLLVGSLALAVYCVLQTESFAAPVDVASILDLDETMPRVTLHQVAEGMLTTDKGRAVPLYVNPGFSPIPSARENKLLANSNLTNHVIRIGHDDQNCNCHGWTFAAGQYWLSPQGVQMILDDNGYQQVGFPQAGDLAVYRNGEGNILHTGIVRLVELDSGRVLIESKWASLGRFLHAPDKTCYGGNCKYYHSHRPGGHQLLGISASKSIAQHN